MDVDDRPPTLHKLRPHQIGMCTLLYLYDRHKASLTPAFAIYFLRFVLTEVSEVAQPKNITALIQMLKQGPDADSAEAIIMIKEFTHIHEAMSNIEYFTNFFGSLSSLFQDKGSPDSPHTLRLAPMARRSIFGYFLRRCCVSFIKLDLTGVTRIHSSYIAWAEGKGVLMLGYEPIEKDREAQNTVFKTDPDRHPWARADAYDVFEASQATGDEYMASESLRRFFEQHFHINSDSGYRQQALLNLARMHYIRKEYIAARDLLDESIMLSRTTNDKITLQHSIALLHRLPPENPGQRPMLSEIQPDINPLEILFDVKKLMLPENEQPLSASFERIFEGIGIYDHWTQTQRILGSENEQWGQHAVQSVVWKEAGCEMLASIEESVVMAFTEHSGDDTSRLTVTLNHAYKRAKDGAYEEALTMLLDPTVWRGLNIDDFCTWSNEIWHILMLEASRNGQVRHCRDYLESKRPPGDYDPTHFFFHTSSPTKNMIRDRLFKVVQMRQCGQGSTVVKELLEALWHCEFQGRLALYRVAVILLADVGLEFGMMNWSKKILEEILPQLLASGDREVKAYGFLTYGRCILAVGKTDHDALQESIEYFRKAEVDYAAMGMWTSLMDVRYILSRVYDNLGMTQERDDCAREHQQAARMLREKEMKVLSADTKRLWEVVTNIGVALASRQMDPTKRN